MRNEALSLILAISLILLAPIKLLVNAQDLVISGNGESSSSEVNLSTTSNTTVTQNNQAQISNDVDVNSTTGENNASSNTGNEVLIDTGDINQEVVVETTANTSSVSTPCCPSTTNAQITDNGSSSQSAINFSSTNETNITLNSTANIQNNIQGYANTGGNTASSNNGNVSIHTGSIKVVAGIVNGPVNVAQIQASQGTGGDFSAVILENGSNSLNLINAAFFGGTNVFINHSTELLNNLVWDANSGGNSANGNNGDVEITTGAVDIELFIRNFVNLSEVDIDCCPFDPGEPGEPGDGEEKPPDNGGHGDDDGEDDGEPEGKLLPSAAAVEAGGPGIIGLSDTSSAEAQALFFWVGLAMIAFGGKLVFKPQIDIL